MNHTLLQSQLQMLKMKLRKGVLHCLGIIMYILWVHLRAWAADGRVMYNETEDQEQCAFTIIQQSVKLLLASYDNTQAFELLHVRSQYVGSRQPA